MECHRWEMCSFRFFFEKRSENQAKSRGERMVRAEAFSAEKSAVPWKSRKVFCCTLQCLVKTGTSRVVKNKTW